MRKLTVIIVTIFLSIVTFGQSYYWSNGRKYLLTPNNRINTQQYNNNFLTDTDTLHKNSDNKPLMMICGGYELSFNGDILVKPLPNINISEIIELCNEKIKVKNKSRYNTFTLSVSSIDSLFNYANRIYESGLVEYAHPDFSIPIKKNVNRSIIHKTVLS